MVVHDAIIGPSTYFSHVNDFTLQPSEEPHMERCLTLCESPARSRTLQLHGPFR